MKNLLEFASPYQAKGDLLNISNWLPLILGAMVIVGSMEFGRMFWGHVSGWVQKAKQPFRTVDEGPSLRAHF